MSLITKAWPFFLQQAIAPSGEFFYIAGQSNAAGVAQNAQVFSSAGGVGYLYGPTWSMGGWGELRSYNCWPLVASAIATDQGTDVSMAQCALGGTSITPRWQPAGDLYEALVARINSLGGSPKCVLWWQGESDTGMTQAQYNGYLDTLANSLYADTGLKLMACQLEFLGTPNNVNLAIAEAWADNANVLTGPDLSGLIPDADGVHLTTDENIAAAAALWWAAIEAEFYP